MNRKCPLCNKEIPDGELAPLKPFTFKSVSAGQCSKCKADLIWVHSWSINLTYTVLGLSVFLIPIYWKSFLKGGFDIEHEINFMLSHPGFATFMLCMIFGIVLVFGFMAKFMGVIPSNVKENVEKDDSVAQYKQEQSLQDCENESLKPKSSDIADKQENRKLSSNPYARPLRHDGNG